MTRILVLSSCLWFLQISSAFAEERLPNVVLIVADDMGYGDAGCYGATDIRTTEYRPNGW